MRECKIKERERVSEGVSDKGTTHTLSLSLMQNGIEEKVVILNR